MATVRIATVLLACVGGACHRAATPQRDPDPACATALRDARVAALRTALDTVAALAPAWDNYTPRNHPVLMVVRDSLAPATDPTCLVLWRHRQPPTALRASAEPGYSTPLYGFFAPDPPGPRAQATARLAEGQRRRIPEDLAASLASLGVTRAVILPTPPDLRRLGPVGAELGRNPRRLASVQADLAVHEGFHLHVQFPAWLDQVRRYRWTTWDQQPDRATLVSRCYAIGVDTLAFRREHEALASAFRALWIDPAAPARDSARRAVRTYVRAREARHATLAHVRVASGADSVDCARAEDVMEFQEGTAQWIGHTTMIRAGLNTLDVLERTYRVPQRERFYQTGAMQLWVLEGLVGAHAMRDLTRRMAGARSPEDRGATVFGLLRDVVRH